MLGMPSTKPVMSEAKHLGPEILRFAQNDSLEKSSRSLVLFLANQGKFFALYHRAIDGDFGDIFAARHIVHDVEHDSFEHRTQRTRACAFSDGLRGERAQRIFRHRQTDSLH